MLIDPTCDALLESNSRSFFLTLKILPTRMRRSVGLLYLLARVADTVADSKTGEVQLLLDGLAAWGAATDERQGDVPDFSSLAALQSVESERELLEKAYLAVEALGQTPAEDLRMIRTCLNIIVGGQTLDLERFGPSNDKDEISALSDDDALDDYAYRVAGSVGEFWTAMSRHHMFPQRSELHSESWMDDGIRFGKALQMTNILRDIPEDLRFGRCYVPLPRLEAVGLRKEDLRDPASMETFRPVFDDLLDVTDAHFEAAVRYVLKLPGQARRLRVACMLPIIIGQRTVDLLRTSNVLDPTERVKVERSEIKRILRRCLVATMIPGGTKRALTRFRPGLR
ncbi:MAG TPA: squalene/phytoene synthase family protein [Candidatus Poseidoniaceae archaeon]|nr:MAG TPA: farnesyl-diphosphate farnesyltransferase [Candidatus Poseidoniales archaeon]HIH53036.1 squalene/phytoene synthase family protein [Candidatus Poseidoniaceae archaeon]